MRRSRIDLSLIEMVRGIPAPLWVSTGLSCPHVLRALELRQEQQGKGSLRTLKLQVTAEGVETQAQHAFLKQHGCGIYQGYLLSRPVPPEGSRSCCSPSIADTGVLAAVYRA